MDDSRAAPTRRRGGNDVSFERDGYLLCSGLLHRPLVERIVADMRAILGQFLPAAAGASGVDDLDALMERVSAAGGPGLRHNCYQAFSRLASLPAVLQSPGLMDVLRDCGVHVPLIQAHSIFFLEPHRDRFFFPPHQDLNGRMSLQAAIVWFPLTDSPPECGGIDLWAGSHVLGPLKHGLTDQGRLVLPPGDYAAFTPVHLAGLGVGDCVIMSPYLVHASIPNRGTSNRWTGIVKVDDGRDAPHFVGSMNPFPIAEYIGSGSDNYRPEGAGS